jgi:hypothetical protein
VIRKSVPSVIVGNLVIYRSLFSCELRWGLH